MPKMDLDRHHLELLVEKWEDENDGSNNTNIKIRFNGFSL